MADAAGPFSTYRAEVREDWLDYNGHMHDASYAIALSEANEELFEALGLSAGYRAETGNALYTVETHIRFLAECGRGQTLRATTVLVAADDKRIRVYTELVLDDVETAATGESLYVHVDTAASRSVPMPQDRQTGVQEMLAAHVDLPRPPHLGAGVGERMR
jgi:acyl-CoA thioester hydrolase